MRLQVLQRMSVKVALSHCASRKLSQHISMSMVSKGPLRFMTKMKLHTIFFILGMEKIPFKQNHPTSEPVQCL